MIAWHKKTIPLILLVFLFLAIAVGSVGAIDDMNALNRELDKEVISGEHSSGLWLNIFKLFVVLGLIIAASYSVIRIFGKQVSRKMQGTWLHVVDEVILGQNRGIVLCEIGEKLYAIGVTDQSISFLFEVDNPKLREEISQADSLPDDGWGGAALPAIKKKLKVLGTGKSKPERKDFSLLMGEQLNRLEQLSYKGMEEKNLGSSRSDKEED